MSNATDSQNRQGPEAAPPSRETVQVTIEAASDGGRLDQALHRAEVHQSRSRVKAMILAGDVLLVAADGTKTEVQSPSRKVREGEHFIIHLTPPVDADPLPEEIPLEIVFEDDALVVVDKPAGLVVHPGAGNWTGTLVNALLAHCGDTLSGIGGVRRPGIVHRLDKDTSGLIVVAKTDAAHKSLCEQFAAHGRDGRMVRIYDALVWGDPGLPAGKIDANLARSPHNRLKMATVRTGGRKAVTHWRRIATFGAIGPKREAAVSRLACTLETGRTHQIRVHMASVGHPLLGDATYGTGFATAAARLDLAARDALARLGRQALHAGVLGFIHPSTNRPVRFESPLPADYQALCAALTCMTV